MNKVLAALASAFLAAAIALALSCATSPLGRKQLIIVPDAQMNSMGAQAFDELKASGKVDSSPSVNSYVRCVAIPITEEGKDQAKVSEWEIVVFRDETANAFALPGGKIGVHTGILKVAKTSGQLAAVLGHEVGHVIARHGSERVSESFAAQGLGAVLSAATRGHPQHDLLMGAFGIGAQFGYVLPHSRTHESEADVIGLDLMARAGFDPRESVELWRNMSAESGGAQPPEWLSTHPAHKTRIDNLQSRMPGVLATYERARAAGKAPNCVRR